MGSDPPDQVFGAFYGKAGHNATRMWATVADLSSVSGSGFCSAAKFECLGGTGRFDNALSKGKWYVLFGLDRGDVAEQTAVDEFQAIVAAIGQRTGAQSPCA
ncbi:MAG: hypothetical protein V4510_05940 [bacterium]